MKIIDTKNIPADIKSLKQWVMWRSEKRGKNKPTKIPYRLDGKPASAVNPSDWSTLRDIIDAKPTGFTGVGFVFTTGGGLVGIDLDSCRDPLTEDIDPWAQDIIDGIGSYTEVSPSGTGVKIWARGELPTTQSGKRGACQSGAIEIYHSARYFTVTAQVIGEPEIKDAQKQISGLWLKHFDRQPTDADRAREAIAKKEDAVDGDRGHDKIIAAYCELWRWCSDQGEAHELAQQWNLDKAHPPFERADWERKLKEAYDIVARTPGQSVGMHGTGQRDSGFSLQMLTYSQFMAKTFEREWLIKHVLVSGESLLVGGPHKSLKTSMMLDACISLATGTHFLGYEKFEVPKIQPVAIITGESGGATLQNTARCICESRGLAPGDDALYIGEILPNLSIPEHMAELRRDIQLRGLKLVVLDPAYLCTLQQGSADSMSNVHAMGMVLGGLGQVGVDTGCTICLVHHTKKASDRDRFKHPHTGQFAGAGFSENMRQWIVVGMREEFKEGRFKLWARVGGSAGHFGLYAIDVDEGQPEDPLNGGKWDVKVCTAAELEAIENPEPLAEHPELNGRMSEAALRFEEMI